MLLLAIMGDGWTANCLIIEIVQTSSLRITTLGKAKWDDDCPDLGNITSLLSSRKIKILDHVNYVVTVYDKGIR